MNLGKMRAIFGEVVLLTHHARILYLSLIFSPNIRVLSVCTLLLVRRFIWIYPCFSSFLQIVEINQIEPHSPRRFVQEKEKIWYWYKYGTKLG
jgi:hypothetical protein